MLDDEISGKVKIFAGKSARGRGYSLMWRILAAGQGIVLWPLCFEQDLNLSGYE